MAQFPRPQGAIESASDLEVGREYWEVYGIWPPCLSGPKVLTRAAGPFKEHPKYDPIHEAHADYIVFDTRYVDHDFSMHWYANDGNLTPGYSHNDNYWFRTEEEAKVAVEFLRAQWQAAPDLIEREIERREEWRRFDDFYDQYEDAAE